MKAYCVTLVGLLCCGFAAAQTVTLDLTSTEDGQSVSAGATINWQITASVSSGDNAGLAAVTTDLVQDAGNPDTLDIPPAGSVPGAMTNFSRPDGICNPGELNPTTGYTGVQRGTSGALNLIQVGGAQNGFGQALPGGSGVAENATVVPGVGQGSAVVIASGSFSAPSTDGTYIFSLANSAANVFDSVVAAPAVSPAVAATMGSGSSSFSFTVTAGVACGAACTIPGGCADTNGDGTVDLTDLANVLSNFGGPGGLAQGDTDGSGTIDLTDLANILALFGTSCP